MNIDESSSLKREDMGSLFEIVIPVYGSGSSGSYMRFLSILRAYFVSVEVIMCYNHS